MLDLNAQECLTRELIEKLPCEIELPPETRADFERIGPASTYPDEKRQIMRVYCGGAAFPGALQYRQSLSAITRHEGWHRVYVVNLSKRGLGFLHSEQLFPGERMRIVLLTGDCRTVEIAWCRCLGASCFRMGAMFVKEEMIS